MDEPDLAKTDGRLLVTVSAGQLSVVDTTTPQRPTLLSRLALPGAPSGQSELFLLPGRALVLGRDWQSAAMRDDPTHGGNEEAAAQPSASVFTLVDLANPAAPRILATDEIEGSYLSARLRGGVVRVVTSSGGWRRPGSVRAEDWLPRHHLRDGAGRTLADGPLMSCSSVRHPATPSGLGVLSVLTYDVAAPQPLRDPFATALIAGGDLVYASADRLYVATTDGGSTRIHAFDATAPTSTPYLGTGTVDGVLLDRWAMSEYEGRLRVAVTTTRGPRIRPAVPSTESAVVVFEEQGARLVAVGRVGGLGRGEQVRAVRWFGDLAAVVTFRQTDPLYLLDVSKPRDPRLLGELKVPGYSAYLHPLGKGLLLGVGQDADLTGRTLGAAMSVFDVRDLSNPRRVDTVRFGPSTSPVEQDARAFTYLPERRLAVLPLFAEDYGASGVVAVTVDAHGSLRQSGRYEASGLADVDQVLRVLAVGDRLAAVTGARVTLLDPDELRPAGTVRL